MPMKEFLQRFQPFPFYIVLVLSITYFALQLFFSHITHALTLLVYSYHMLCNIIALIGCIFALKKRKEHTILEFNNTNYGKSIGKCHESSGSIEIQIGSTTVAEQNRLESNIRNTFGWARIDVLAMLIVFVFMSSLCFSLLVEAIQTLIHIDHSDTMHLPIPVLLIGITGIVLNGICYVLIGGYTYHQGSFLNITSSGEVYLANVITSESVQKGGRRLSKSKRERITSGPPSRSSGLLEVFRDNCSAVFVIICAIIVYLANDENVSKFIDPIISIISCILLLILSYPYMKESCLILLQTIPATIDIEIFKKDLLDRFTGIVSVHDLHIWQLTANKYVSTAHILFENHTMFHQKMEDILAYFQEQGISNVTIQPEFNNSKVESMKCLMQCSKTVCSGKICCTNSSIDEIGIKSMEKIVPKMTTNDVIELETMDPLSTNLNESELKTATSIVDLHSASDKEMHTNINLIKRCKSESCLNRE